jgi:hypothetical protein
MSTRTAAALIGLLVGGIAHAQRAPILVELFTSEGCSSCPPADALLQKLDAEVIVLSEHVDYWDRLGWRDPNSSHEFTARQERYSRVLGVEVYTPQIVVDGREAMVGSEEAKVRAALGQAEKRAHVAIKIESAQREGANAIVKIAPPPKGDVWVGVAAESAKSAVSRGENSGHTLTHVAVLRTLTKLKKGETTVRTPAGAEPSRVVVFVTDSAGQVNGADSVRLP